MLKISDTVRTIIQKDARTLEIMEEGLLNLSAYAKKIHKEVKKATKKPVALGSIIVCLSRLAGKMTSARDFRPFVKIDSFSIISDICEITYHKSAEIFAKVARIVQKEPVNSIIGNTSGIREITLICRKEARDKIMKEITEKPKFTMDNLVGITVNFSSSYMDVPNTVYSLVSILAVRKINLIEIVSTYTEVTFVIPRDEMRSAIEAIELYSNQST